jgi:hypothetical protein
MNSFAEAFYETCQTFPHSQQALYNQIENEYITYTKLYTIARDCASRFNFVKIN